MDCPKQSSHISSPDDVDSAGTLLVDIASRDSHQGQRAISHEERVMLDECFARAKGLPSFEKYHIGAIRKAVQADYIHMVEFLLSRDTTHQLLSTESDILQLALWKEEHYSARDDSDSRLTLLSLLIDHGAQVNAHASNGDTALYLTCDYGFPDAFQFLISRGADYKTLHPSKPYQRTDAESALNPPIDRGKVNLLRISLDARLAAEGFGRANTGYSEPLAQHWGSIIEYLFGVGLKTTSDDGALVKFLHVACYQGNSDYVDMVLRHGVDLQTKAPRIDDRDTVYGSALHAAAAGGHREVVLQLLQYGADPRTPRLQEYMKGYVKDDILTPIAAALRPDMYDSEASPLVLHACEAIAEAGVGGADQQLLIRECAKSGEIKMLQRLLGRGIKVDQVPLCSNIDAITLLLDDGASMDAKDFQKYAVSQGLLELLQFLAARFGPLLTSPEDFQDEGGRVRLGDHSHVLEYLICDYGLGQSGGTSVHSDIVAELFQILAQALEVDMVQSILQRAAGGGCPGLRAGVLTTLTKMLHRYRFDRYNVHGEVTKKHVQMYQLLLNGSGYTESSERTHDCKLWLTPDVMPQLIWDNVASMPRDESSSESKSPDSSASSDDESGPGVASEEVQSQPRDEKDAEHEGTTSSQDMGGVHEDDNLVYQTETKTDSSSSPEPQPYLGDVHCSLCAKNYRFTYDRLDGSYAIRVLSIEPSTDPTARLQCHLITTNLGQAQQESYEALSYVWGDISDTVSVTLNSTDFFITRNLGSALCRLRLPTTERRLWVDALCINQNFLPERNQQVGIMREIYQRAERTLVWVGEDEDDSHLIFEHIKNWTTYRDDYRAGKVKKSGRHRDLHLNMPNYAGPVQKAFEKFCLRPYFYRTWVIQEIAISKQALVICGPHQEELDLIVNGTSFRMGNIYDPFEGVDAVTHFTELRKLGQSSSLESIMQYSRYCGATDPRDKVYGLIGLFLQPLVSVDYALKVETVYTDFTKAIIDREKNLQFLHWLGVSKRQVANLPSWVPDYTASTPTGVLPRVYHRYIPVSETSTSLQSVLPGLRVEESRLNIRGSHLDTMMHIGGVLAADKANYPESSSFRDIIQDWERTAAKLLQFKRYPNSVTELFLKTLTAGQSASIPWYLEMGSGVLNNLGEDYLEDYTVLRAWRREGARTNTSEEITLSHFKRQLKECCYGRRLFVTENGSMGLAPADSREGDLIVYFSGGLYPFALRPAGDDTFVMVGDCYLYEPMAERQTNYEDFNEFEYYKDDVYRNVTEWIIQ